MYLKGQSFVLFYLIYLSTIYFFSIKESEVCNFADVNTFFCGDKNLDLVFLNLNGDLSNVMDWFKTNSYRANPSTALRCESFSEKSLKKALVPS